MEDICQVFKEMRARNGSEASAELAVRSRSVDEQNIEPEQAEEREKYQDYISDRAPCADADTV